MKLLSVSLVAGSAILVACLESAETTSSTEQAIDSETYVVHVPANGPFGLSKQTICQLKDMTFVNHTPECNEFTNIDCAYDASAGDCRCVVTTWGFIPGQGSQSCF